MSISRASKGGFASWWFTVDKVALLGMAALIGIGLMLAFAASPAITGGPLTAGDFHYAGRQIAFAAVALAIMGGTSLLSLRQIKIAAALVFAAALVGSFLVLFLGADVLGARRELNFGFMTLQPSEFLKPGFAVLAATVLADRAPMPLPKPLVTLFLCLPAVLILLLQPDVGQTGLLLSLWGAMLFFAGLPLFWVGLLAGVTGGLGFLAYVIFPHVHHRVAQYLSESDIGYQAGLALKAFAHGGFAGVGPGAGTIKYRIPDAHSDYIFAVAGEEFGLVLCVLIAALFCLLTVRLLLRSANARDPFCQLAGAGLAVVTAVQAFINMGVAVSLLPAKGMTLPFISYGGSSLFSIALTMGFALAVTRQRPKIGAQGVSLMGMRGGAGMNPIVLSAGGTGGHLFPAQALAGELTRRGRAIVVMTDARFSNYATAFPGARIQTVPSAAFSDRSALRLIAAPFEIAAGIALAFFKLMRLKPAAVIGFGGYPSLPVMLAASFARLPTAIIEQNAVVGRANRLVMNRVGKVAAAFPIARFAPRDKSKIVLTGNPLRPEVTALWGARYEPPRADGPIRLLIFGGSQGARAFSQIVPAAITRLSHDLKLRLSVVQQCRPEDIESVREIYANAEIRAELGAFFTDLPVRIAAAHLVIGRAGAGTVAELMAIGRPAILVPLPHALDDNQTPNADIVVDAGGGWRVAQKDLDPDSLARLLTDAFRDPSGLARRAAASHARATPDAASRLADLVESLAHVERAAA